jgi:hypothetical protein
MKPASPITGSRACDLLIALAILATMLLLTPRLRVYFNVTVVDVSLAQIAPDGRHISIPTPAEFEHIGDGYWPGDTLVSKLKPKIDTYMVRSTQANPVPAGTRFEWTVRWSENSRRLDHADLITWDAP